MACAAPFVLVLSILSSLVQARVLSDNTLVVDDSNGLGLKFEGVGAISGGGATTKLLYDYPEEEQSKVLDMLFSPNKGVGLQMLKVEIGGDTDATEGAEPSHMHFDGDENYNRGYEWWLMKEAKKRNPNIKLYGLPWGWPGTLDTHATATVESLDAFEHVDKTSNYTVSWLLGAERVHGLKIDYVGLWNEKDVPEAYTDSLREAVSRSGLETTVLDRMEHYSGSNNTPDAFGCQQYAANNSGQMWSDEEGSMYDGRSARCLARVLNRNYISKCKTATFQWHLVSSFYDYLPWPRCGLAVADQPWSGNFEITSPTWAVAHTTQFADIGWRYAAHGSGVAMLPNGGSMVTRISQDRKHFSIVIEKIDSATSVCGHGSNEPTVTSEEEVVIELKGSFLKAVMEGDTNGYLNVWRSNLASGIEYGVNPPDDQLFQNLDKIKVGEDGVVRLMVHPEEVFTLTNVKRGHKEIVESAPKADFPIPFEQSFDSEGIGRPPRLWYDQMGAWEVQRSPYGDDNERGNVMRQVVPVFPNCWGYSCEPPVTYFGPSTLNGDLTVSLDIRLEDEGYFSLNPMGLNYSVLDLGTDGNWKLWNKGEGKIDFPPHKWHSVKFRMMPDGSQEVTVNGESLYRKPEVAPVNLRGLAGLKVPVDKSLIEDQCTENSFPLSTKGQYFKGLKVDRAKTLERCRMACCKDENLCDVWQFDGTTCQMGRMEGGYDKDMSGNWIGGRRWDFKGWHLKLRLSKYMYVSVDNFRIERTGEESQVFAEVPAVP